MAPRIAPKACLGVLELFAGDAFDELDAVLRHAVSLSPAGNATVALMLDGPKGRVAVRLAEEVLERYPTVAVAAVHDVPRLDPRYRDADGEHLTRTAMEAAPRLGRSVGGSLTRRGPKPRGKDSRRRRRSRLGVQGESVASPRIMLDFRASVCDWGRGLG